MANDVIGKIKDIQGQFQEQMYGQDNPPPFDPNAAPAEQAGEPMQQEQVQSIIDQIVSKIQETIPQATEEAVAQASQEQQQQGMPGFVYHPAQQGWMEPQEETGPNPLMQEPEGRTVRVIDAKTGKPVFVDAAFYGGPEGMQPGEEAGAMAGAEQPSMESAQ